MGGNPISKSLGYKQVGSQSSNSPSDHPTLRSFEVKIQIWPGLWVSVKDGGLRPVKDP
jgi:hypothetical protein